jgi:hypothetical protein
VRILVKPNSQTGGVDGATINIRKLWYPLYDAAYFIGPSEILTSEDYTGNERTGRQIFSGYTLLERLANAQGLNKLNRCNKKEVYSQNYFHSSDVSVINGLTAAEFTHKPEKRDSNGGNVTFITFI